MKSWSSEDGILGLVLRWGPKFAGGDDRSKTGYGAELEAIGLS